MTSSAATAQAPIRSYGRPWLALTIALACHVADEALTGFLPIYNMTVLELRRRIAWFPMPAFGFGEWLGGLIAGVLVLLLLTPLAYRGARWLRPLGWFFAVINLLNGMGHTLETILGHTVSSVRVPRPAPGFYSSPLLLAGSIWLMVALRRTASTR